MATTRMEDFFKTLAEEINAQVEPIYGLRITLITVASQGDFRWFYENANGVFNQGTFDYVSARVLPGDGEGTAGLSPSGGFPNAYIQVVTAIFYALSPADEELLNRAVASASAQATMVVRTYQESFGIITDSDLLVAQAALGSTAVANKQDYVIGYILGYLWSGRRDHNQPALSYSEMAAAPNLPVLLPLMPSNGGPVVQASQKYLDLLGPANQLEDGVFFGGWTIAQLKGNTARPSDTNGGMKTVDPNTGAVLPGDQVGYAIGVTLPEIQQQLDDKSRVIRAVVEVEWTPSSTLRNLLRNVLQDDLAFDLARLEGTGNQAILTIEYPGFTLVPTGPLSWKEATNTGWFSGGPIAEAQRNLGQAVTGFQFTVAPPYNLGPLAAGGDFGLITDLLISDPPIVTVEFPKGDPKRAGAGLATLQAKASQRYTVATLPTKSGEGVRLLLRPLDRLGASLVPPLQQTAYVIGGTFDFPGDPQGASAVAGDR